MPLIRPCLVLFTCLAVLTGVLYPLLITAVAQAAFPEQAAGSLLRDGERIIGSRLIGQPCGDPGLFWPRPSAVAWNASGSGGANLAPVAGGQLKAWTDQAAALRIAGMQGTIPADLVTASGSGLDPHLSPDGVLAQVRRVAAARGLTPRQLEDLIARHTEQAQLGVLGAARVNVLELNLVLTTMRPERMDG